MNESNVGGKLDQIAGKIKQGVGETFGNEKLANEGAGQEIRGHAKEAWGNTKDTAHDIAGSTRANADAQTTDTQLHAEHNANDARHNITSAAEHAKDSINRGLDHLKGN